MRSITVDDITVYVSDETAAQIQQLDILYRVIGHAGTLEIPAHTDIARDVLVAFPVGGGPLVLAPHVDVDPADPDNHLDLITHEVLELRADLTENIESTETDVGILPDDDIDVIAGMAKLAYLREHEHEVEDLEPRI